MTAIKKDFEVLQIETIFSDPSVVRALRDLTSSTKFLNIGVGNFDKLVNRDFEDSRSAEKEFFNRMQRELGLLADEYSETQEAILPMNSRNNSYANYEEIMDGWVDMMVHMSQLFSLIQLYRRYYNPGETQIPTMEEQISWVARNNMAKFHSVREIAEQEQQQYKDIGVQTSLRLFESEGERKFAVITNETVTLPGGITVPKGKLMKPCDQFRRSNGI